jgi:hypothetical protein
MQCRAEHILFSNEEKNKWQNLFVNFCAHLCAGNLNVDAQQRKHSACEQCPGSGCGIRCLFDPWIRDLE